MYAIINDGNQQYKVREGQQLDIDYREDASSGESIVFERVLAVGGDDGLKLGKPTVSGASVTAEVVGVVQGDKVYVRKFRRRKNSRSRTGHRQIYTTVKIGTISAG